MATNVLIITCQDDCHSEAVIPHLRALNAIPHVLIAENAQKLRMTISLPSGNGVLRLRDGDVRLHDIDSVWYRKPNNIKVEQFAEKLTDDELQFIQAESQETMDGLYALLHDRFWLTNPPACRLAARKLLQLSVAHQVGFVVPRSIVTSEVDEATRFAQAANWDIAIKSLSWASAAAPFGDNILQFGVFCRRLTKEELLIGLQLVRNGPTLLQEYVAKRADLRVVAVGRERLFPVEIASQKNGGFSAEDCRFRIRELPHRLIDIGDLAHPIHNYMERFGLQFGCFDFALAEADGKPIFLECNTNGQWRWLELATGVPIARAVAEVLAGRCT